MSDQDFETVRSASAYVWVESTEEDGEAFDAAVDRIEAERDRLKEFHEAYEAADRGEDGAFARFVRVRARRTLEVRGP